MASSYGMLLGTETSQSFVGGIVAFRVLPRPQFSTLQAAIFPIYFTMQTALPLILALTFPAERTAEGMKSSSIWGVLEPANRLPILTPLLAIFLLGLANAAYIGPATSRCMREKAPRDERREKELRSGPA